MSSLRPIFVILCIVILYCALRRIYFDMFHQPRIDAISRDLTDWFDENAADDDNGDDETRKDVVSRRDKILKLRNSMGIGIDSLPTVRFGSNDNDRKKMVGKGNEEEAAAIARRRECLTHGAYVSSENEYVDCRSYCNVSDGVEYRYYDRLGIFLNGRRGRIGGYCVPTDAATCNTNTSLTVYGREGWKCFPQTRAFAGEGGNRIVVCNGRILDRASGKIWYGHIDSTLEFDLIDEMLSDGSGGGFRFVCPPGMRDERDNLYVSAPFDRLFLLHNTCAKLIPHADDSIVTVFDDDIGGYCDCGKHARYDPRLGVCVPLAVNDSGDDDFFDERTLSTRLYGIECWEPWMTISQAQNSFADKMCGVEHENAGLGAANVGYMRYYGTIFDRAVPSPTAMLSSTAATAST